MNKARHSRVFIFTSILTVLLSACLGAPAISQPSTTGTIPQGSSTESSESSLPPAGNSIPSGTDSTPAAGDQINILDVNSFKDEANYWYFFGLIRNDTANTIYDVQIDVKLLDRAGGVLYTYTTGSMFTYLAPGEVSPFSDFTADPFPAGYVMQAQVVTYQQAGPMGRAKLDYRGLTLWANDKNNVFLAGEVFNGNSTPVEINAITGALEDASGKLVTASASYPNLVYIEPNQSSPFVIMFDTPTGMAPKLTQYKLYIDALTSGAMPTYDITVSEKQNKYQDANGNMHLVGTVTNNASKPMNVFLLAGMYDKNGNVLDANVVYPPLPINPGATFPYDFNLWGPMDYVPQAYDQATDYKLFIDWLSTSEASAPVTALSTEGDTNAFNGLSASFKGSVVNNSGKDISTAFVSVSLYDKATGDLVATNLGYVSDPLPNAGKAPYEVNLYPPNDIDPTTVTIVVSAFGQ